MCPAEGARQMSKTINPKRNIAAHSDSDFDRRARRRTEKRGLFELEVDANGFKLKQHGRLLPSEAEQSQIMYEAAKQIVTSAQFPIPEAPITHAELLSWAAKIQASSGSISLPGLAANFIVMLIAVKGDIENDGTKSEIDKFSQILSFASAWHAFHLEVFGAHELAFGKAQHAAGQARGANTTADKGARRAAIISSEIEKLRNCSSDALMAKAA